LELDTLRKAGELTRRGHLAAMRAGRPGTHEYELQAVLERDFRGGGGRGWGYYPIVAAGENATVLHYNDNNAQVREGDLVLIDAGAEFDLYTADVTRTWPASRTFSDPHRRRPAPPARARHGLHHRARPLHRHRRRPGPSRAARHRHPHRRRYPRHCPRPRKPDPRHPPYDRGRRSRYFLSPLTFWVFLPSGSYGSISSPYLTRSPVALNSVIEMSTSVSAPVNPTPSRPSSGRSARYISRPCCISGPISLTYCSTLCVRMRFISAPVFAFARLLRSRLFT